MARGETGRCLPIKEGDLCQVALFIHSVRLCAYGSPNA